MADCATWEPDTRQRLVVIGNGMAAGRTLEELFARAPGRYDVTIFGAEPRVNYNRIMLSPVLSGEATFEEILIHDEDWYAKHRVTLRRGQPVVSIDRAGRYVVGADGQCVRYDRLIIATGSVPIIIPVPGNDLPGVRAYRDFDDVDAMKRAAKRGGKAVVIGGGLLGLEAAAGLAMQGMKVSVVHLMPTLMERQLDAAAAKLLQLAVENRDIQVVCDANTRAIMGVDRAEGVELEDGRILPCDLVVMAVGIRPNVALAEDAGLDVGRGIKVDDGLATSDPAIFAVGECAEHRGVCYGLVAPLYDMGKVLAARLAGDADAIYSGSVTATKLKVTGIHLFSAGDLAEKEGREEIVLRDDHGGTYRRLVIENDRLVGAVLYGDTVDGPWFFDLLRKQAEIRPLREALIFGDGFGPEPNASKPPGALEQIPKEPPNPPRQDADKRTAEERHGELEAA